MYIYTQIHIHIKHNITQHKKEWSSAICNNMSGYGGNFAKWNKSARERKILYTTYMWNLKKYNKLMAITKEKTEK